MKVCYFWCGYVRDGTWVANKLEDGHLWFLIDDPEYSTFVETKEILPYDPMIVGSRWDMATRYMLQKALLEKLFS